MGKKKVFFIAILIIILSLLSPIFITLIIDFISFITLKLNIPSQITILYPYEFKISEISSIITSFVFSFSTLFLSYNTFSLSKKINNKNEKNEELLKHASLISLKNEINSNVDIILKIANNVLSNEYCSTICTDIFDKYNHYKSIFSKEEINSINELYEYFKKAKKNRDLSLISKKYFITESSIYILKKDELNIINIINNKEI